MSQNWATLKIKRQVETLDTPRKAGWGNTANFPKPLPYLWPESANFATFLWPGEKFNTLFMTVVAGTVALSNFWRAFIFVQETYQIQELSAKTLPLIKPKWPKSIPYLWPKKLKNPTLGLHIYLRTLWLGNRFAKPMFYCTGKPRFPIYGCFRRELENSKVLRKQR